MTRVSKNLWVGWLILAGQARAQVPGLPDRPRPSATASRADAANRPATAENPKAAVATATGPIAVKEPVADPALRRTLERLLPKYPGVREVEVEVAEGVVTLGGRVRDDDVRGQVTEFVRRVEGVRLVLNRMETDAQVLGARALAEQVLSGYWGVFRRKWLLIALAVAVVLGAIALAGAFGRYSETLLAPFVANPLLRSVVGSLIGSLLVLGGVMLALSVLDLTRVVLSILGLAGVVGLAVGFAFKDIAENFIASVLLGVRRPFRVGDYVQVAGYGGVVKSLNTRATVLVTLEGNHVRIPNSTIFKEILVNSSASSSTRGSFDLVIPYEASTADALEEVTRALREQDGVLPDPPARALVEALEPGGVRLRTYFWAPSQGVDGMKLASDARLKAKVALQQAGIAPPPTNLVTLTVAGEVPVAVSRASAPPQPASAGRPGAVASGDRIEANFRKDREAAATLRNGHHTAMDHILHQAETRAGDEGDNLLR